MDPVLAPFRLDGWNFNNVRIKRASELRAKYLDYHGWKGGTQSPYDIRSKASSWIDGMQFFFRGEKTQLHYAL